MTMHTFGSAIDTRLAVYTIAANTNAVVNSPLFPVAANDDFSLVQDPSFASLLGPNGPAVTAGPSAVRFPVALGTTYYVAVDSNVKGGQVQLTWGYNFGGLFYFTKPQVEAAKTEGFIQFAVGRAFGLSGQVKVTVVSHQLYEGGERGARAYLGKSPTDYVAGRQTLTFQDHETMQTFLVPIFNAPYAGTGNTNFAPYNPNYYFNVQIVSVQFDPNENTNLLASPAILKGQDVSVGRMLDVNIPYYYGDFIQSEVPPFTNNIINFMVKHQTTTEYVGDYDGYAHVWFTRTGNGDPTSSCTIHWGINSLYILGDLENNQFDLWPESDYATPPPPTTPAPGVGPADFGIPPIPGPPGGITVDASGSSGTVSWAPVISVPRNSWSRSLTTTWSSSTRTSNSN